MPEQGRIGYNFVRIASKSRLLMVPASPQRPKHAILVPYRKILLSLGILSFSAGIALLGANGAGFLFPLRSPDINGYVDFAGSATTTFAQSEQRLDALVKSHPSNDQFVTQATRIFHDGIAHVAPRDVKRYGGGHYRMRVPISENWILYLLSYLKPDTYRDYEFCSYRRALERGVGRCGQQSLALVSFLAKHGMKTGFIALGGHSVATAEVDDHDWYILDPDYGAVIPKPIEEVEKNPDSVLPYYWSNAAKENGIQALYAPANRVVYGGPEARYARACPIETVAYLAKWIIPLVLVLVGIALLVIRQRGRRRE